MNTLILKKLLLILTITLLSQPKILGMLNKPDIKQSEQAAHITRDEKSDEKQEANETSEAKAPMVHEIKRPVTPAKNNPRIITHDATTLMLKILDLQKDFFRLVATQKPYKSAEYDLVLAYGELQRTCRPLFDLVYIPFADFITLFRSTSQPALFEVIYDAKESVYKKIPYGPTFPDPENSSPETIKNVERLMDLQKDFCESLFTLALETNQDKWKLEQEEIINKEEALIQEYENQEELYSQIFQYLIEPRKVGLKQISQLI